MAGWGLDSRSRAKVQVLVLTQIKEHGMRRSRRAARILPAVFIVALLLLASAGCGAETPIKETAAEPATPAASPSAMVGTGQRVQPVPMAKLQSNNPSEPTSEHPAATASPSPTLERPAARPSSGVRSRSRFVPLDDPAFMPGLQASYLDDDDLVLGYKFGGEARAYPIRMMRFHHIVNDWVQGKPVLITY